MVASLLRSAGNGRCDLLDGRDDGIITGAPAEVAAQRLADLFAAGLRVVVEQRLARS